MVGTECQSGMWNSVRDNLRYGKKYTAYFLFLESAPKRTRRKLDQITPNTFFDPPKNNEKKTTGIHSKHTRPQRPQATNKHEPPLFGQVCYHLIHHNNKTRN